VILAGRRINDSMGKYIAEQTVKQMIAVGLPVKGADVIVLGLTFKEDCSDLRNSKVIDVITELKTYGVNVHVHDPIAATDHALHEYGVALKPWAELPKAHAVVAAVSHREYKAMSAAQIQAVAVPGAVFVDVKSAFNAADLSAAGMGVWRL
jgi:UDP-N-acetyl-D-glucosamine/UDP-N-acetyl-D-galactosamine dehydrogenase